MRVFLFVQIRGFTLTWDSRGFTTEVRETWIWELCSLLVLAFKVVRVRLCSTTGRGAVDEGQPGCPCIAATFWLHEQDNGTAFDHT